MQSKKSPRSERHDKVKVQVIIKEPHNLFLRNMRDVKNALLITVQSRSYVEASLLIEDLIGRMLDSRHRRPELWLMSLLHRSFIIIASASHIGMILRQVKYFFAAEFANVGATGVQYFHLVESHREFPWLLQCT